MHSPAPCLSLSPYRGVSGTGMNDPWTHLIDHWNSSFSRFKNEMPKWCSRIESPSKYFWSISLSLSLSLYIKLLKKKYFQNIKKYSRFNYNTGNIIHCAFPLQKLQLRNKEVAFPDVIIFLIIYLRKLIRYAAVINRVSILIFIIYWRIFLSNFDEWSLLEFARAIWITLFQRSFVAVTTSTLFRPGWTCPAAHQSESLLG